MNETHGSIAVPDIHKDCWLRLAGVRVDDLDIKPERNTLLVFGDISPNILAGHVCFFLAYQHSEAMSF